jgi:EAL domain-containing protein (putative c-di-GMP-specific phosphodiesterase class I)
MRRVETEQQCSLLRDKDCDEMQGYLFSPPLPPAAVAALLLAQGPHPVPAVAVTQRCDLVA